MKRLVKSKITKHILGIMFVVAVMFASLQMNTKTTYALEEGVDFEDIIVSNPQFDDSKCLRALDVRIQAKENSFPEAYGKIGIHNAVSTHDWYSIPLKAPTYGQTEVWPDITTFREADETVVSISTGKEFMWTDYNEVYNITVEFGEGEVDCSKDATYYIYLWTRRSDAGIYPDCRFKTTLKTSNGKLFLVNDNGEQEIEQPAYQNVIEKINAIGTVENTEECKAKIEAARAAYAALTEEQKAKITAEQYKILTDAEEAYDSFNSNGKYEDVKPSSGSVTDITGTAGTDKAQNQENPYSVVIKNNTESELESIMGITASEKAQGVNVWLEVVDASATMSAYDKEKINSNKGEQTVGLYLDASIFKKVGSNTEEKVHELNGKIKVSMIIPEILRKEGRTFSLVRVHNGVVENLGGTYDASTYTFTFETDKFSSYAILYKDPASGGNPSEDDDNDNGSGNNESGSIGNGSGSNTVGNNTTGNTAGQVTAPTTATSPSPKTGDTNALALWIALAFAALLSGSAVAVSKLKNN